MSDASPAIETPAQPDSAPDFSAAIAEISSGLFGRKDLDETEGAEEAAPSPSGNEGEEPPPQEAAPASEAETSSEVSEAPTTWRKEAKELWAGLPEGARAEILKREQDMFDGLAQYRTAAQEFQKYDQIFEPYKPILAAENIDPAQLVQGFAANHYLLSRGTPEQKIELAANLVTHYGIDLAKVVEKITSAPAVNPEIEALKKELYELKNAHTTTQQAQWQKQVDTAKSEIDAFAAAHPHFEALQNDIAKLLETGAATTLQQAYDTALYANPETRQLEIARLTAEQQAKAADQEKTRAEELAKAKGANLKSLPKSRNGAVPVGTLDETLEATLAEIRSRA